MTVCCAALPAHALPISDVAEWDSAFERHFSEVRPELDVTDANDNDRFAWNGHYWLRAYLRMADMTGDTKYLDWTVELIDHMWLYTDELRVDRGELNHVVYYSAPLYYLQNPDEPTISWRRGVNGEWRVGTLLDGMTLQGMTRFIHLVERDARFAAYRSKAAEYLPMIEAVIAIHDDVYSYTKSGDNPGSYYYGRASDPFADWGDPDNARLYSSGRPYNHNATMAIAVILLDDLYDRPEYRRKAEGILQYWQDYVWTESDAYVWNYSLELSLIHI